MSEVKVNKISPRSGTTVTLGDSGDTITLASGVSLTGVNATFSGDLTVDTDTLFVDASADKVGIGTTTLTTGANLTLSGQGFLTSGADSGSIAFGSNPSYQGRIYQDNSGSDFYIENTYSSNNGDIIVKTNGSERLRVKGDGNVGIGTSSPDNKLHIQNGDASASSNAYSNLTIESSSSINALQFLSPNTAQQQIRFGDPQDDGNGYIAYNHSGVYLSIGVSGPERLRINSSGSLLVGKTTEDYDSTAGLILRGDGLLNVTRSGGNATDFNRLSSDGEVVRISKDGTTVGSIASHGSGTELSISASGTNASGIYFANSNAALPMKDGGVSDNTQDLGGASERWDDIYATNGTIQTSDQNEKQSIQALTSTEIAVAKRISKLFKTFKWNSAVEEKGDNARIHTGVIAQDVQQAFADEGLDAGNYAFFMSNTYWEKEISVDAVAEELDEEGNVIVEGKDAYTYIDKKEEATEGYTERTRLGIRYPELLSFVSSAFEQRLTNIETRLTALET